MERMIEGSARAQWQSLHTAYVMAHEQYMLAKLARDAAQGQPSDLTGSLMAREKLFSAHEELAQFCRQHAEYC